MKNIFVGFTALSILLGAVSLHASSNKRGTATASEGGSSFYVGSALDNTFVGDAPVLGLALPALSALVRVANGAALQFYLAVPGLHPFTVGGGASFKQTVAGTFQRGLHIGGGLGLGALTVLGAGFGGGLGRTFFINIAPMVGIHFELVPDVMVNLDSGIVFKIRTSGTNEFDMAVGGNSALLGLSVLYAL